MGNEFTEEELEAIDLSNEMLEEMRYEEEQRKKFHSNEIKTNNKLNIKNIKNRKFKNNICNGVKKVAPILLGAALISTSISALYNNSLAENNSTQIKAALVLETEVEVHGGKKDMNSDKYIWNLNSHIESKKCAIPKEDGLTMEDRIEKYCKSQNLSDEVMDAAIAKFNLYYSGNMKEADNINLVKMVKEEQKLLEEEEKNSYSK